MKRKLILLFAFIILVIDSLIFFSCSNKNMKQDKKITKDYKHFKIEAGLNINYGKYVETIKKTSLYKKNNNQYVKVGSISKNSYLNLVSTINNDISNMYLQIDNTPYYVKTINLKKIEKKENTTYDKYVTKYKITTKNNATIKNDNTSIKINEQLKFDVLKNDSKYYIEFNNNIFWIEETDVLEKETTDNAVATSVPVLNYHFFYHDEYGNYCKEIICLSKSKLDEQLRYLSENEYKTLTMQEFIDWYDGKIELPEKSVLLTIDDGGMGTSISDGNVLIPLLEKYKVNATLFLITAWWDKSDYDSFYLDVESHGYDIHKQGNCNDKRLICLSHDELKEDLNKSINLLGSNKSFCYPFYRYTNDAINVIEELDFKVAFVGGGRSATRNDNRYLIPRYPIVDGITLDEFINMVK